MHTYLPASGEGEKRKIGRRGEAKPLRTNSAGDAVAELTMRPYLYMQIAKMIGSWREGKEGEGSWSGMVVALMPGRSSLDLPASHGMAWRLGWRKTRKGGIWIPWDTA